MKQSVETLKSYFKTGEIPTQVQFENLIDSLAMPMIGEIKTIGFATVPSGWAKCDGQLLKIAKYETLFNLIGTTYGGNGITNFALPDLRDKVMVHQSQTRSLGQNGGTEENTLSESQLPTHSHGNGSLAASHDLSGTVLANDEDGTFDDPIANNFALATISSGGVSIYNSVPNSNSMAPDNVQINGTVSLSGTTAATGSSTSVNNMQPYLVVTTIMALEGINPLGGTNLSQGF